MITFNEGMPGHGKSYDAVANQIIPELLKGRQVFAYVEGLNYDKFSEITSIPVNELKGTRIETEINVSEREKHKYCFESHGRFFKSEFTGLLHQIESDQVKEIYKYVADDSFVVIDELQDYFPSGMKPLEPHITKFVTQHRHRGIDILVMGQSHKDCHNLWKRRINRLVHFQQREAIGRPQDYTWSTYIQQREKFVKLQSGKGTYDSKYFGLYKSHNDGVEKTDTTMDDRINVFKSPGFKYGIPAFLLLLFFSLYHLAGFFGTKEDDAEIINENAIVQKSSPLVSPVSLPHLQHEIPEKLEPEPIIFIDYLDEIAEQYRPRLAGLAENERILIAYVDFLDGNEKVYERMSLTDIESFGWTVERTGYGLLISKDDKSHIVRPWPLDNPHTVPVHVLQSGQLQSDPLAQASLISEPDSFF